MLTALSLYDKRIAPPPRFEYYTPAELAQHAADGYTYAAIDTSHNAAPTAHCAPLHRYNEALDIYLTA
jgi:hypothetical protein